MPYVVGISWILSAYVDHPGADLYLSTELAGT